MSSRPALLSPISPTYKQFSGVESSGSGVSPQLPDARASALLADMPSTSIRATTAPSLPTATTWSVPVPSSIRK